MITKTEEAIAEIQWLIDEMEGSGGELYGVEYERSLKDLLEFLNYQFEKE
jgi:hypothetical protein